MAPLEKHLPSRAVAKILGVGTHTLAVWRAAGRGPQGWFHLNKSLVVYPESDVQKYIEERKTGAGSGP